MGITKDKGTMMKAYTLAVLFAASSVAVPTFSTDEFIAAVPAEASTQFSDGVADAMVKRVKPLYEIVNVTNLTVAAKCATGAVPMCPKHYPELMGIPVETIIKMAIMELKVFSNSYKLMPELNMGETEANGYAKKFMLDKWSWYETVLAGQEKELKAQGKSSSKITAKNVEEKPTEQQAAAQTEPGTPVVLNSTSGPARL